MKAFLLAAGLGTRLKPFTDSHPKALAEVNNMTLLEWNIKYLQKFGIQDIVINIHHFGDQIVDLLDKNNGFGSRYYISDESNGLLETGGALLHAKDLFKNDDNILMMNVDILSNIDLKSLIQYHLIRNPLATLAIQHRDSSRKLLFNNDEEMHLIAWKNTNSNEYKPSSFNSNLFPELIEMSFSGIQVINSRIFDTINQTGKFSIIDTYLDLMKEHTIIGYNHTGDILLDVGKPESLIQAQSLFSNY